VFDGKINMNGEALILVDGRTGASATAPGHPTDGTKFSYTIAANSKVHAEREPASVAEFAISFSPSAEVRASHQLLSAILYFFRNSAASRPRRSSAWAAVLAESRVQGWSGPSADS